MKKSLKIGLPLLLCLVYLLSGCSTDTAEAYEGGPLKIAVMGTIPSHEFNEVRFVNVNIDDLFKAKGQYDALFVTEETFSKTSRDKYIDLYKSLPYPTFFIGLNEPIEAFVSEGFSLSDFEESKSMAFAQGYYKNDKGTKEWTVVPSEPLNSEKDYRSVYVGILKSINNFQY